MYVMMVNVKYVATTIILMSCNIASYVAIHVSLNDIYHNSEKSCIKANYMVV